MGKRIVLLQALASTPRDLALLLSGVSETAANRRPDPESWSIVEILCHLVDIEARYRQRLARVLKEERPFLPCMNPDPASHSVPHSPTALQRQFSAARNQTLDFLGDLEDDDWEKTAVHESLGATTLFLLVQNLIDHDAQHLNQLVNTQKKLSALPQLDPQPAIQEESR